MFWLHWIIMMGNPFYWLMALINILNPFTWLSVFFIVPLIPTGLLNELGPAARIYENQTYFTFVDMKTPKQPSS